MKFSGLWAIALWAVSVLISNAASAHNPLNFMFLPDYEPAVLRRRVLVRRTADRLSAKRGRWSRSGSAPRSSASASSWSRLLRHPLLAQAPGREGAGEGAEGRRRKRSGDGKVLAERMNEALETLKRSSGKQNFLYDLPWYVIIGPPGAGKTTALVNSGLNSRSPAQDGAACRRRRRHALLRLVVHRGGRADRHRRPLHHAGFRRRGRQEELARLPALLKNNRASSRSTASSSRSASRTC